MKNLNLQNRESEKGFTLVELAVVMIIIGLLIGGVLKGQELITNARVTATTSELKSYSAAMNGFIDKYSAIPGDMIDADDRLPENCDGDECPIGDGDARLDISVGALNTVAADGAANESGNFFVHLLAADFVSGYTGSDTLTFGEALPTSPAGGGYFIGDNRNGLPTGFEDDSLTPNPYLILTGSVAAVSAGSGVLTPSQAARIDRKLDDGRADSGVLVAQSTADNCVEIAGDSAYQEKSTTAVCVIAYRLQ